MVQAADKDDPTGTWKWKTKFGEKEFEQSVKLELKDGKLTGSMPGFLAGLVIDPENAAAAITLSNGTRGDTPSLAYTLIDVLAEHEPLLPEEWSPEPVVDGADELLGPWYWGNTPYTMVVRDGSLLLDNENAGRRTRLERVGADTWRGLDNYFTGEPLHVVRRADGSIDHGQPAVAAAA